MRRLRTLLAEDVTRKSTLQRGSFSAKCQTFSLSISSESFLISTRLGTRKLTPNLRSQRSSSSLSYPLRLTWRTKMWLARLRHRPLSCRSYSTWRMRTTSIDLLESISIVVWPTTVTIGLWSIRREGRMSRILLTNQQHGPSQIFRNGRSSMMTKFQNTTLIVLRRTPLEATRQI